MSVFSVNCWLTDYVELLSQLSITVTLTGPGQSAWLDGMDGDATWQSE